MFLYIGLGLGVRVISAKTCVGLSLNRGVGFADRPQETIYILWLILKPLL